MARPRPEHAVIKYGDDAIHYAVAIPAGEARYVLDRNSGQIRLEKGPSIFLCDPRREVIVRRVLDQRQVGLWFPGNNEAMAHNQQLAASKAKGGAAPGAAPAAPPARPAAAARWPPPAARAGTRGRRCRRACR